MDQDVLSVKPVPRDKPNFLVSEGNNHFLTSAVLRLEKEHPILGIILPRLVSYEAAACAGLLSQTFWFRHQTWQLAIVLYDCGERVLQVAI